MEPDQSLEGWIRQKYPIIGLNKGRQFVGEQVFINRLIGVYGSTEGSWDLDQESWKRKLEEIRQLVKAGVYLPTSTTATEEVLKPAPGSSSKSPTSVQATKGQTKVGSKAANSPSTKAPAQPQKPEAKTCSATGSTTLGSPSTAYSSVAGRSTASSSSGEDPVQLPNPKSKVSTITASTPAASSSIQVQLPGSSGKAGNLSNGKASSIANPSIGAKPGGGSGSRINTKSLKDNAIVDRPLSSINIASSIIPETRKRNHVKAPLNSKIQELIDDIEMPLLQKPNRFAEGHNTNIPMLEDHLRLLGMSSYSENSQAAGLVTGDVSNAVMFSTEVLRRYGSTLLPQYALLGSVCPPMESLSTVSSDPRLFLNTNVPFSAFICGLQGSGKSHTMSCVLESCLIENPILGLLQRPLSALVFHFGQYTSRSSFRPCEAAFLAYSQSNFREHIGVSSVNIMVAPSNYHSLNEAYSQIPGVRVRPFKLRSHDLNIGSILTLMSVNQTEAAPLYMGQVIKILRDIATESPSEFDYRNFKKAVESCKFTKAQKAPLQQRLDLLESFLDLDSSAMDYNFEAGSITIIDLSCPFVDANTACVLFNICIGIYLGSAPTVGKVIAIDEAHKYMTDTPASKALTESLLTVIRQQRHYGARVIISTQEPIISPRLMDLCSMIIIHRFSSPEWFDVVRKHISIADTDKAGIEKLFGRIINLRVGEALLYATSAIISRREEDKDFIFQLSSNLLKIKIRNRLTWDAGKSVVSVNLK